MIRAHGAARYSDHMEAVKITARWEPASPVDVSKAISGWADKLSLAVNKGLRVNASLMAEELKMLTPRSPDGADHVADGWTTRDLDLAPGVVTIEIFNANPRFDEALEYKGGTTSLGAILEYGTAPHKIEPRNAPRLAFFWPAVGKLCFAKSVEHPGTRPYGMMAVATAAAIDRGRRLMEAAQVVARQLAEREIG